MQAYLATARTAHRFDYYFGGIAQGEALAGRQPDVLPVPAYRQPDMATPAGNLPAGPAFKRNQFTRPQVITQLC